jgi:hypothetical protein
MNRNQIRATVIDKMLEYAIQGVVYSLIYQARNP